MRKLLLLALFVGCFCITAAAQDEDPRGRYIKTGERVPLTIFGSLPAYNGNPSMLDGLGRKTAGELGIAGKKYWNQYPTYAEKVILNASAMVRYDTATMTVKYLDDCRWWDKKKKVWVYHPNQLLDAGNPTASIPPAPVAPVVNTTLTVTKTVTAAVATLNVPIQYTVIVKNTGAVPAKNVQLRDSVASTTAIVVNPVMSVSSSYTGALSSMVFTQDLAAGSEITIVYTATLTTAGLQVPNVVTVWASNAPPAYAQVVVTTAPPEAITTILLECPKENRIVTWATLGEKLGGGKIALALSVGVGAGGAAAFSSDGYRGKQALYSGIASGVANRIANFLNPSHNRARLVTPSGESQEIKKGGEPGSFVIGEFTYQYTWTDRRFVVTIPERGCLWSASPKQTFNFTPIPIIKRVYMKAAVTTEPVKPRNGKKGDKKAPN